MKPHRNYALAIALSLGTIPHAEATAADMTVLSLEQLLEVKVVGASKYEQRQSEVAAAVSVITRQEIKAFGWRTLDEALASLPGIYTTYDRQYVYLGSRGFSVLGDYNTRVLLTINGNRVNDAVYDQAYLGRDFPLDLDLIDRIEFIPGPGGAVYGQNALFGVVNVVTRSGSAVDGAELAASVQRPQSSREGRASWGKRLDNGVDLLLSASGLRSHGEDRYYSYGSSGISGVAAGLDGERDQEFFAHLARGPWSFDVVYGDRRKDDPTGVYLSDPLVPGTAQGDRMLLAQLNYQDHPITDQLRLSGRIFLGREQYEAPETFDGASVLSSASSAWRGVEARLLSTAWAGHKVLFGVEFQDNTRQDQYYDDLVNTPGVLDVAVRRTGWRTGLFVQDEWALSESLAATLGLRVDRNNVTGTALSPRVALVWRATGDLQLKTLFGRAHRAPNVYEHDYDDGVTLIANPALRGETINTLEFVSDYRVDRELAVRASVYRWTMDGLVTQGIDPASELVQYQNGEPVTASGVELSADKTWAWGGRLRGSVSLQHAAFSSGATLANSPRGLVKLNFSSPLGGSTMRLAFELFHAGARRDTSGGELGGYTVCNLTLLAEQLAPGLEGSLTAYNVFDAHYQHPGSRNNWQNGLEQDGRSLRLKLSYRY